MSGGGGPPLSPTGTQDFIALQQENKYLREENETLRRRMYNSHSGGSGHYQPGEDVKSEAYGQYGGGNGGGPLASPREEGRVSLWHSFCTRGLG